MLTVLSSDFSTINYMQAMREFGSCQDLDRASVTVKGMDTERRKSDRARLAMKKFLAVLKSFVQSTTNTTQRLLGTAKIVALLTLKG